MTLRDEIVANALWGAANEPRIHYTQAAGRMDGVDKPRKLPLHTDCSGFVTCCYSWAGAPDPNGRGYNGTGWTGTLLEHLEHIDQADLQPADPVVFGPGAGDHVVIVVETGPDPLTVSHGQEKGPFKVRLSVEKRAHRAPMTCLRGAGLDNEPSEEDDMAQVPQKEWDALALRVAAIQQDMDDLKARTPSREQLDAIIGPEDGMQVTLARIERVLADLVAKVSG